MLFCFVCSSNASLLRTSSVAGDDRMSASSFSAFRGETPVAAGRCPALHTGMRPSLSPSLNKILLALLDYCVYSVTRRECDETCVRHFHQHASYTAASARQVTSGFSLRRITSQCFLLPAQLETLPGNLCAQLFSVIVSGRVCNVHPRPNRRHHIEDGCVVFVASFIGHFSCRRSLSQVFSWCNIEKRKSWTFCWGWGSCLADCCRFQGGGAIKYLMFCKWMTTWGTATHFCTITVELVCESSIAANS